MVPVLPAVPGHAHAVVVAEEHVAAVLGVDPEGVVVAAEAKGGSPLLPAVAAAQDADAQNEDVFVVRRVDDDLAIVISRRAADAQLVRADFAPGRPGVLRPVDLAVDHAPAGLAVDALLPAVLGRHARLVGVLDHGVEDLRLFRRNGQADAAEDAAGQAVREFHPGPAAVGRLMDTGAGPAEPGRPGLGKPGR